MLLGSQAHTDSHKDKPQQVKQELPRERCPRTGQRKELEQRKTEKQKKSRKGKIASRKVSALELKKSPSG